VANIRIDPSDTYRFGELFSEWAMAELKARVPNGLGSLVNFPTADDHTPGEIRYRGIAGTFLDVLRANNLPFTLMEP
jgi:hypothetical protein